MYNLHKFVYPSGNVDFVYYDRDRDYGHNVIDALSQILLHDGQHSIYHGDINDDDDLDKAIYSWECPKYASIGTCLYRGQETIDYITNELTAEPVLISVPVYTGQSDRS